MTGWGQRQHLMRLMWLLNPLLRLLAGIWSNHSTGWSGSAILLTPGNTHARTHTHAHTHTHTHTHAHAHTSKDQSSSPGNTLHRAVRRAQARSNLTFSISLRCQTCLSTAAVWSFHWLEPSSYSRCAAWPASPLWWPSPSLHKTHNKNTRQH